VRYYHDLDETAPGAELTQAEAEALGREYLATTYDLDVSNWNLVESEKEERDNRIDYTLIWEEREAIAAEAHVRAQVLVQGDEPSGFANYLKVPEEWLRVLRKPGLQTILMGSVIWLLAVLVLILGVLRLPQHHFRWKVYTGLAAMFATFVILMAVNDLRKFGFDYETSVPWGSYVFQQLAGRLVAVMGVGFAALIIALYADLHYAFRFPLSTFLPPRTAVRGPYYRDAVLIGISAGCVWVGLSHTAGYSRELWRIPQRAVQPALGTALDAYLPGLNAAIEAVLGAALSTGLFAVACAVLMRYIRSAKLRTVVAIVALGAMSGAAAMSVGGFFLNWAEALLLIGLFVLGARFLLRQNLLAYLIAFSAFNLVPAVLYFAGQPLAGFKWNAVVAVAGAIIFLLAIMTVLVRCRRTYEARDAVR
jgi:hypothetical protein